MKPEYSRCRRCHVALVTSCGAGVRADVCTLVRTLAWLERHEMTESIFGKMLFDTYFMYSCYWKEVIYCLYCSWPSGGGQDIWFHSWGALTSSPSLVPTQCFKPHWWDILAVLCVLLQIIVLKWHFSCFIEVICLLHRRHVTDVAFTDGRHAIVFWPFMLLWLILCPSGVCHPPAQARGSVIIHSWWVHWVIHSWWVHDLLW